MLSRISILAVFLFLIVKSNYSQVELVNPNDRIYDYLQRMQVTQVIPYYNPANIPLSREAVASYLKKIYSKKEKISLVDKELLKDYYVEYQFELTGELNKSVWIDRNLKGNIFSDKNQKYIYAYADSNATLFLDALGNLSQRGSAGDSIGNHSIALGELGFRVRGTLYNSVGYYLRASNGQKLSGDSGDVRFARNTDPKLFAQYKFEYEQRNFDTFDGYLRYRAVQNWLALTVGRNPVYQGFGYIDKLFLSHNTVPFDFLRLDLAYKTIQYSFLYGSLRGDSLGRSLNSKNLATHRLDVQFTKRFKMGLFESVTIANSPFSFTFLNPLNFLTSAELSKASQGSDNNVNNSIIGIDAEVIPLKKFAMQFSFLIDDIEFSTLFKSNAKITNKFAWQIGALWADACDIPNLEIKSEYTRLDPFVYSHVSNKTQYTNWNLPLGHHLEPNSDEIALSFNYDFTNRIRVDILYQFQRSANGIVRDTSGRILVNYGGNRDNASGYSYSNPEFLKGFRINRNVISVNCVWQFIRQFYFEILYVHRIIDNIYQNNRLTDDYGFATLRIDY